MANTCEQDVFYYCTHYYNPLKDDAPLDKYGDYVECVKGKTLSDCGHEFVPELMYGGTDPYHTSSGSTVYVSEPKPTTQLWGVNKEIWILGGVISVGILISFIEAPQLRIIN